MSTTNERLAEIKARVEAIRDENPYSYSPWDDDSVDPTNAGDVVHAAVSRGWDAGVKAEVPALVAALEAVLEKHRPVQRIFSWSSGIRDEEPCPDCHGKAVVHDCGCWADEDITYSCATCRTDKGGGVDYPCPTVEAVTEALGVDQ